MVFFLQSLYYVLSISSCSLFLMMMVMMNLVFAGPTGLSLKLIHRDSPESPLYQGNFTKLERMERAFQQSIHREQKLLSTWRMKQVSSRNNSTTNNSKNDLDKVRPGVKAYDLYTYMVQLGIGTFSNAGGSKIPSYYYFYFDTGSDLLWLQCDPTRTGGTTGTKYFKQDPDVYRGQYSFSYRPLPYYSPNPICKKYVDLKVPSEGRGFCGYHVSYGDGSSSTEGVLATEKLTVGADNGGLEEIKDFVFGCGFRQNEPDFGQKEDRHNPIVGILGLGGDIESFIVQLGRRAQYKFEYCLKPWYDDNPTTDTFLRFGSDTKIVPRGQGVQTTHTTPTRGETLYYVSMEGISVDGEPVVYPEGSNVFEARQDGTGGCIFDSGTDGTLLSAEVYGPFRDHLVTYFSTRYGLISRRNPIGKWSEFDLCFETPDHGFDSFPIVRFHFSGATFEIETAATFSGDDEMFCLTIQPSNLINSFSVVVGAFQQVNHRILYDVRGRRISWIKEDCATDP